MATPIGSPQHSTSPLTIFTLVEVHDSVQSALQRIDTAVADLQTTRDKLQHRYEEIRKISNQVSVNRLIGQFGSRLQINGQPKDDVTIMQKLNSVEEEVKERFEWLYVPFLVPARTMRS